MATPKETVWQLDPHTEAKHRLLRAYLGAWFPILSSRGWNGRVFFLDGFAGPGRYKGGEQGSPVIALETLLDHPLFPKWSRTEFLFAFLESEPKRHGHLCDVVHEFVKSRGGLPKNIKVRIENVTFEEGATSIVDTLATQKKQLAPTFAFVDPFGFSGVPLSLIGKLLAYPKCEVFFNFMFDSVNRFLTVESVKHHIRELFESDVYAAADKLTGGPRKQFLHDLYQSQLSAVCGFDYVRSFEMINQSGHTGYYLFYGTRHLNGLRVMKDAMWRVDPSGTYRFSDRFAGQDVLFGGVVDTDPLRAALRTQFAGKQVSVAEIEEFTLIHTPYSASHWNRATLNPMERSGEITVVTSSRSRAGAFPPGTVVRFL